MPTTLEHKGIATIIENTRLAVPKHQRSFEWTDEEVKEFLDDIDKAFQRGREEYFLGSIVVIQRQGDDQAQVLDGQQRLATASLLLASIADGFASCSQMDAAVAVRQMVSSYDIAQGAHLPHVRLNQDDDLYFRSLLSQDYREPARDAPESHSLLFSARNLAKGWVRAKIAERTTALEWLKEITAYLKQQVCVIYFGVPDDSNAYAVFETLNDRGLDLSTADLLKNYLLGRADDGMESVLGMWMRMLATLKAYGCEDSFKDFLRHYWASMYELVREKDLYRNGIKARIISSADVVAFASDLAANSYLYTALLSPEHEYWSGANAATRERLRTLAVLGLQQYRPMLLAALARFDLRDVERTLEMLEAWNVRLVIVGGLGGGTMEARYAELGRAIHSGQITSVRELAARAREFIPGDAEFQSRFAVATVSKVSLARYYLQRLEAVASGGEQEVERLPNPALTLEHVLPERPGTGYPQFTEDERRLYTRRLGNLALLTHRTNSDAKSAPFPEKREVFRPSSLLLTQRISEFEQWDVQAIETRQRELAELAVRAWPLRAE